MPEFLRKFLRIFQENKKIMLAYFRLVQILKNKNKKIMPAFFSEFSKKLKKVCRHFSDLCKFQEYFQYFPTCANLKKKN